MGAMKRCFAAFGLMILLVSASSAQTFNEAGRASIVTEKGAEPVGPIIGGPVGSPTYVIAPQHSSVTAIGKPFGDVVGPYIDALVQAAIAALLSWLGWLIHKKTGIEIDAKQREALSKALANQAGSLISDGVVSVKGGKVEVHPDALKSAAAELLKSVPDAIKHFDLKQNYVEARIIDTIPQTAAGAQMIAKT